MPRFTAWILCVALTLGVAGPAQARTSITTNFEDLEVTQDECLARADRVIRRNGYTVPGTTANSRHGTKGEYTVTIRCAADRKIVFFVVAGPNADVTDRYLEALQKGF